MKKLGVKPTDTQIDIADLVSRNVLSSVISEETPKQELQSQSNDDKDEDDENEKEEMEDKKELRVKTMQFLNPRIIKSQELKDYMKRANVQEAIIKRLNEIATEKMDLYKKAIAINVPIELGESAEETEQLDEANRNVIKQGRTKVVKARVRGGKVQRRKRVSAVKGYTIRGGKLKRMSMAERIRRKRGQRRGKVKRKAKMARALMRRKRSLRKRASLGLKE